MPRCAFVYDEALLSYRLRDDHPLIPSRLRMVYELLEEWGAFDGQESVVVRPRQAEREELLSFHTPQYVDAVERFSRGQVDEDPSRYNFSDWGDNPIFPGMYEAGRWVVGASLTAVELLLSGEVKRACNFGGGLHHAMPGYASGFCVFNDPVIAIQRLLREGLRVAYVDIDAHHGDGVQHAFYDTDRVLTISLHESGQFLFPGTGFVREKGQGAGEGYSVNVPLYPYTDDEIYHWAFQEVVPPLVRAFRPDVLVTQLGIDTHMGCPITHMRLTVQGYAQVVRWLADLDPGKWLLLGGGGYNLDAVARGWAWAYGIALGREWPDDLPPGFVERYGIRRLRDTTGPDVDPSIRREAWAYARRSVEEVKRTLFPYHGL